MKTFIFIIIGAVISAFVSGYLFRMGIENWKKEQIIVTKFFKLSDVPPYILTLFGTSFFMLVMSIALVIIYLKNPY